MGNGRPGEARVQTRNEMSKLEINFLTLSQKMRGFPWAISVTANIHCSLTGSKIMERMNLWALWSSRLS